MDEVLRAVPFDRQGRIFVAGHRGMVGSAIVRKLKSEGYENLILKTRQELDLLDQAAVHRFFRENSIDYVFHAAARVGGIYANNTYRADFLYENLVLATNVLHAAAEHGTKKLLYLGSSCIYPRGAPQPLREESLLSGSLEQTNEPYAISKIAGLKLCESYYRQYGKCFISAMPTNLYGIGDNFHPENSHVIPGMMRRFHEAKLASRTDVKIWGTGKPKREFLHADDLAAALFLLMQKYNDPQTINVGTAEE
ncbi:MAG: GDP-L-fucose synthase family protein, partial [Bdellovibrionota bacterium]